MYCRKNVDLILELLIQAESISQIKGTLPRRKYLMGIDMTLLRSFRRGYFISSLLSGLRWRLHQDMDEGTQFASFLMMRQETWEEDSAQKDLRVKGIQEGLLSIIL